MTSTKILTILSLWRAATKKKCLKEEEAGGLLAMDRLAWWNWKSLAPTPRAGLGSSEAGGRDLHQVNLII